MRNSEALVDTDALDEVDTFWLLYGVSIAKVCSTNAPARPQSRKAIGRHSPKADLVGLVLVPVGDEIFGSIFGLHPHHPSHY